MSETKRLFQNSLQIFTGQICTNFLTIGFTIYFAHTLKKEEFATIAIFNVLLALCNMISNFGIETFCLREIPLLIEKGDRFKVASLIKTACLSRFIWSGLFAATVFFQSEHIAFLFFKNPAFATTIKILSVGMLFGSMNVSFSLFAQALKLYKEMAAIQFLNALVYCLFSLLLFLCYGYKGWVIGFTCSRFAGLALYLKFFNKWFLIPSGFYSWFNIVKKAFPFYARGYMRFGLIQLDQLIIGIFMTPEIMATYYVAKTFSNYISFIIEAIGKPLLVKIIELKHLGKETVAEGLRKISRYNAYIFIPICLGIATFGYPLLEIYGGTKYLDAYPLLLILCMAQMLTGIFSCVYIRGVFVLCRPSATLFVDTIGCIVNTVSLVLLSIWLGTIGIAISIFLSVLFSNMTAYIILQKKINFLYDKLALYRSFFASGIAVALALTLQFVYYNLMLMPFYVIFYFLVFLVIITYLFDNEDIIMLEKMLDGRLFFFIKIFNLLGLHKKKI